MSKHFDLATFTFNDVMLRTLVIDGIIWFAMTDIAKALGADTSGFTGNHKRLLAENEKLNITRSMLNESGAAGEVHLLLNGSANRTAMTSESGLYKIVLRAQRSNPAAKEFQDWITQEVIPRIRKNGGYVQGVEKVASG